jgi:pyridoxine 5-phosphate synthase
VPDKPDQLTSNHGWDTLKEQDFLRDVLNDLRGAGIRSSIFIDADERMAEMAAQAGADRVELYTGPYAHMYAADPKKAIEPFLKTARRVKQLGIGLNAGHDLSLENLKYFTDVIPWVDEVSIGHALICDALYMGLEKTIVAYQNCLKK